MNKVVIIGTVGIPSCYGGFESLVENLTLNQSNNIYYNVICSSKSYSEKKDEYNNSHLIYIPLSANGVQSIFYDILSLIKCWFLKPDAILILGVSGCLFLPIFRFFSRAKVITNIDGLEWKRDKWGKCAKRFLKWSEAVAVKYSDVIITDNEAISDYVSEEYNVNSETIAYGGDHAIRNIPTEDENNDYALGLCRIEPENNVTMILEAYSKTEKNLKFVGNWNSSDFGKNLKKQYIGFKNIELLEPIYDLDDLYKLRNGCSLYLHGHSAGGTNPSLVEMMHFKKPIFAFDCSFNRYSTENKAHYFESESSLLQLICNSTQSELIHNAEDMIEIAKKKYTWSQISHLYESTYTTS